MNEQLGREYKNKSLNIIYNSHLAIHGGEKIRKSFFPSHNSFDQEEEEAVVRVVKSGILSRYLGAWHKDFYGGPEVQALEQEWATYFRVKHAISVNSATSGLIASVGALGIEPGDEVIVSPYTMTASAVGPLFYGAIPVFADIEEDYFCLDVKSVEERITPKTRAIIAVDLFGQVFNAAPLRALADKYGIKIIEDAAQAPGALLEGSFSGTFGDVGVYSLNYHKHIHCGEGGIIVTNDDLIAERLRMIRNHAEAVVDSRNFDSLINMVGFNFRMTELEAAVARIQLKKLKPLIAKRQENVSYINQKLSHIDGLVMPQVRPGATHVYCVHALQFNPLVAGVSRDRFGEALKAELMPTLLRETEGVRVSLGYLKPLYLQSLYQKKIAFGKNKFPWLQNGIENKTDYSPGICPVAEKMHFERVITHDLIHPFMLKDDLDDVVNAFYKVWECRNQL